MALFSEVGILFGEGGFGPLLVFEHAVEFLVLGPEFFMLFESELDFLGVLLLHGLDGVAVLIVLGDHFFPN